MEKCVVENCASNTKRRNDVYLFRFPHYISRCRLWAEACGVEHLFDNYVRLGLPLSTTCYRVCGLHFEDCMFVRKNKKKLHPEALPTRFLNNSIRSAEKEKTSFENSSPSFVFVSCLDGKEIVQNSDGKSQVSLKNVQQFGIKQEVIDVVTVKAEDTCDESINDIASCPAIKVEDMDSNELALNIKEEATEDILDLDEYESSFGTSTGISSLENVRKSKTDALEAPKRSSVSNVLTYKNPLQMTMYRCEICNFKTKYKGVIDVHMVTHETRTNSRLDVRMITHKTREKSMFINNPNLILNHFVFKHKVNLKYKCTNCTVVKSANLGRKGEGN